MPESPLLLWQTLVPGALFSGMSKMQTFIGDENLAKANLREEIVVLGYWRAGTTLPHELLCLERRYTFPTTHACMNPHNFLFTAASVRARKGVIMHRPMDEMGRSASPQEDAFAFLCLGARSPYEALMVPSILREALKLTDPQHLSPQNDKRWREVFLSFLSGVSAPGNGRPMILKSPTHGARLSTLRELLPDARYVLISRDPLTNFESVVRMWKKLFESYAIGPMICDDEIGEAVLLDRPRFEESWQQVWKGCLKIDLFPSATSGCSPTRLARSKASMNGSSLVTSASCAKQSRMKWYDGRVIRPARPYPHASGRSESGEIGPPFLRNTRHYDRRMDRPPGAALELARHAHFVHGCRFGGSAGVESARLCKL